MDHSNLSSHSRAAFHLFHYLCHDHCRDIDSLCLVTITWLLVQQSTVLHGTANLSLSFFGSIACFANLSVSSMTNCTIWQCHIYYTRSRWLPLSPWQRLLFTATPLILSLREHNSVTLFLRLLPFSSFPSVRIPVCPFSIVLFVPLGNSLSFTPCQDGRLLSPDSTSCLL